MAVSFLRMGSFFERFRLPLADVWTITIVLMWSESVQVGDAAYRYEIDRKTIR